MVGRGSSSPLELVLANLAYQKLLVLWYSGVGVAPFAFWCSRGPEEFFHCHL